MTTSVTIKNNGPKNIEIYTGTLECGAQKILKPTEETTEYVHSSVEIEIRETKDVS